jgi:hypothetical protein
MLFVEYDVSEDGQIELVALINALEEDGADPYGEAWLEWRRVPSRHRSPPLPLRSAGQSGADLCNSDAGLGCDRTTDPGNPLKSKRT